MTSCSWFANWVGGGTIPSGRHVEEGVGSTLDLEPSLFGDLVLFCFVLFFVFLGSHPQHVEVPRLGVALEL